MSVEIELVNFLEKNIKDGSNKSRDIEIIKFYYGLNESPWPTLEETASRFKVGTRERIRQLLNSKFRDKASKNFSRSLIQLVELLKSRDYWLLSEFEETICSYDLIETETHLKGIFNLIEDVEIDSGFEFYTPDLKRATRNSISINKNLFLISDSCIQDVEKLLKKAKGLPGRCGIANLVDIKEELGQYYQLISLLIKNSSNSWVKPSGSDYWYIFENRDNTLINCCEKIFSVIETCDSRNLSITLRRALSARTYKYKYPPHEIIEEYLKSSIYTVNTELGLKFIGHPTPLNDIEKDLILFFDKIETASFTELREYLSKLGHGDPYINRTTSFSPLVFVDKSKGLGSHVYSLIGKRKLAENTAPEINTYEHYLRRLRLLLNAGTDDSKEQITRKEQHILQDWLFKDKTHENCALCGQEFSVKSLITAHKKPRAECNDAERLDPYIVMPLCVMGCDYLYENMYVYVQDNEIKRGIDLLDAKTELTYIEKLVGRKINPKWLLGSQSFFRFPKKLNN